jgi:glycosyltransferase involved in cell wall biosynthesis
MALSMNCADRIHFKPVVSKVELADYLSKCSLFVLPSLFEMFPVVLLEAMASEKAVIASQVSGAKDIIKQALNGFLFEKTDIAALRECLDLCLSDDSIRDKLGANAKRCIEERFTFQRIANEYLRVFDVIA